MPQSNFNTKMGQNDCGAQTTLKMAQIPPKTGCTPWRKRIPGMFCQEFVLKDFIPAKTSQKESFFTSNSARVPRDIDSKQT